MVRRMSKRRRSIFSPSLENSSMPERDASADRAHALPVDAHQRRHGIPGRVHAQPCDLPLEVTRVRALASRHSTIATVTPCSAQSTLRGACSSRSLAQPMSRCRQRRTPSRSYGRPRSPHLAHRSMSLAYGRTGTMTTSPPRGSFSTRGTPATTFAGRTGMRLSAPADMVGTGVPLFLGSIFLAETNLTGERPFHTRTRKSPGNGRRGFPTTQTGEDSFISCV